jgi:hypothetical protein
MQFRRTSRWQHHFALVLALGCFSLLPTGVAHAQFVQSAVGGVLITPAGVVGTLNHQMQRDVATQIRQQLAAVPASFAAPAEMRKISLKQLDLAVQQAIATGEPVPDDLRFLGGLTRVEFVLVSPTDKDVYLAGPAEAWKVNDQGEVVGQQSGRPIVLLDDLIVALRTATAAREVGISCSIEPTAEGARSLQNYLSQQKRNRRGLTPQVMAGAAEAFGPQQVLLSGVPTDTHFACVLVAADYQMKRFAMKLEKAPIDAISSYPDLMVARRARPSGPTPRWWMACNYEPISRSEDGTTWRLNGQGVRVATEDHILRENGQVQLTGKTSPIAQEWADSMTSNYEQLSTAAPVFGQLRNVMDLSVVAALIEKEQLLHSADCQIQLLNTAASDPLLFRWNAPVSVDPQVSAIPNGREHILTASGGVQVTSWQVAQHIQVDASLASSKTHQRPSNHPTWWWD